MRCTAGERASATSTLRRPRSGRRSGGSPRRAGLRSSAVARDGPQRPGEPRPDARGARARRARGRSAQVGVIVQCSTLAALGEGEIRERIEQATGVPAITVLGSTVAALRELGARRVVLGSPYTDEQNDELAPSRERGIRAGAGARAWKVAQRRVRRRGAARLLSPGPRSPRPRSAPTRSSSPAATRGRSRCSSRSSGTPASRSSAATRRRSGTRCAQSASASRCMATDVCSRASGAVQ